MARDLTRLAYVAKDGTPRNVPIGITWNGAEIVMCTTKNAPKLPALRLVRDALDDVQFGPTPDEQDLGRVHLGVDRQGHRRVQYLQMNGTYAMTAEQRVAWEVEVRSLYDGMVRIVVTPTWAKLIDFETPLPSAVEELIRQRDERRRAWPRRARSLKNSPREFRGGMSRTGARLRPWSEQGPTGPYRANGPATLCQDDLALVAIR